MIKAVLFDCDGVLLDTEPMGCASLAQALSEAGHPMDAPHATRLFSGNAPAASLAVMDQLGLDAAAVFARSDQILFDGFARHLPLIAGIETVLAQLSLKRAVCSNSTLRRLDLSLGRSPLAGYFGPHIYSSDHVAMGKPAPDIALLACAKLGIAPHEALFIDDNIHGMICAKRAGCLAVGFIGPSDHRLGHDDALRAAGADHVVCGMAAFQTLLATLTPTLVNGTL